MRIVKEYQDFQNNFEVHGRGSSSQEHSPDEANSIRYKTFTSTGQIPMLKIRHKHHPTKLDNSAIDVIIQTRTENRRKKQPQLAEIEQIEPLMAKKLELSPIRQSAYQYRMGVGRSPTSANNNYGETVSTHLFNSGQIDQARTQMDGFAHQGENKEILLSKGVTNLLHSGAELQYASNLPESSSSRIQEMPTPNLLGSVTGGQMKNMMNMGQKT